MRFWDVIPKRILKQGVFGKNTVTTYTFLEKNIFFIFLFFLKWCELCEFREQPLRNGGSGSHTPFTPLIIGVNASKKRKTVYKAKKNQKIYFSKSSESCYVETAIL